MKIGFYICIWGLLLWSGCGEKPQPANSNCEAQQSEIEKLREQLDEQTKGQIQLNNLIISLTTNYMSIDSSLKQLQKIAKDPGKKTQFNQKAEEVESFFFKAQTAIDSVESSLASIEPDRTQSLVALEAIKRYLNYQQNLYVEVFSTISSYSGKLRNLKSNLGNTLKILEENKETISEKEQTLAQTRKASNRVYYISGTKEDLVRAKVASKEKKGLGLKTAIKLSDKLDPAYFEEADLNQLTEIDLGNSKDPVLLTNHPKDSYFINIAGGEAYLRITNPEKFWSATRFLVVQKDK